MPLPATASASDRLELMKVAAVVAVVTDRAVRAERGERVDAEPLVLEPLDEHASLGRLAARAALPAVAADALRILVAGELDRHVHRGLRRLAEDPTRPGIEIESVVTVAEAVGRPAVQVLAAFDPEGPLVARGLVNWVGADGPLLTRRVTVPPAVLAALRGAPTPPAPDSGLVLEPPLPPKSLCAGAEELDRLHGALAPLLEGEPLLLVGPPGVGKRTLLATLLDVEHGKVLLTVEHRQLARRRLSETLPLLWRHVLIYDAVICIANVEDSPTEMPQTLVELHDALARAGLPVALTATTPPSLRDFSCPPHTVELRSPDASARATLWQSLLPECNQLEEVASRFRLTPGRIVAAATSARRAAAAKGRAPTVEDTLAAVSRQTSQMISTVGNRWEDRQTWDDVILPDETMDAILELLARARLRHRVMEEWGFSRKLAKGLGLSALFCGAPGTGKTMVAGLIARELGLELYQIDLSRIVSKYIGETEKNLSQVFDAADGGNVLLLFDEADSLFAKRTEVKSSIDRYSNLEVNYLLQRLERFEGISVLTTNLDGSIDPAFKRRLAFRIQFPAPDVEERRMLWQRLLPAEAAVDDSLDFGKLAAKYELAGGHIRNAVVRAAFLAAAEGAAIGMRHLERAVALEYRDAGKLSTAGRMN